MYYTEENGRGVLVADKSKAMQFDGSGKDDLNLQVIHNTVYVTSRVNATAEKKIDGNTLLFTKQYSGGKLLNPIDAIDLVCEPGYVIPETNGWATHESWPWYAGLSERWTKGWTGIDIQPEGSHFTVKVSKGGAQQFTADGTTNQVTWSIKGETTDPATTISADGLLFIGSHETATMFVVYAKAKDYKDNSNQGAVAIQVNEQQITIDKTALQELVNSYVDLDTSLYTDESYQAFLTAYEKAIMLLEADTVSQEAIDAMVVELKNVYDALAIIQEHNVEETTDSATRSTPDTGDTTTPFLFGGFAIVSLLFLGIGYKRIKE